MIHPIEAKSCAGAWLKAANLLATLPGRCAYNVILDIETPISVSSVDARITRVVDTFLRDRGADPIATVAATIFPASDYRRSGAKGVFDDFPEKTYPRLTTQWGTYAGRMLRRVGKDGKPFNPLKRIIERLQAQRKRTGPLRAVYELGVLDLIEDLPVFDPAQDSRRNQGQPCLAHLSFKLRENRGLMLTALYRNHYYVQRTLGNLIGLSQLLYFTARESELTPKSLVCHSTLACLDTNKGWGVSAMKGLLQQCNKATAASSLHEIAR